MPISFNSPARNFFLLAASGQQEITAFIRRITSPSLSDTYGFEPSSIEYEETDQKYLVAGSQVSTQSDLYEGYLKKVNESGSETIDIKVQSTTTSVLHGTTIRSMTQDGNGNIIICGRKGEQSPDTNGSPYVGKFDFFGNNIWYASTTEVSDNALIEYTDIAVDGNNDIYVVGYALNSVKNSILSKYNSDGDVIWSQKILDDGVDGFDDFRIGNVSVNSRGELIVTGSLEGITKTKGLVAKYDTSGNSIWIKTFEDNELATSSSYRNVVINSSYVDGNDYIYCAGYSEDPVASKYKGIIFRLTPEGNILWQNKTNYANSIEYTSVSADTLTGQVVVAGEVWTGSSGFTFVHRYNGSGQLTWTRKISSTNARSAYVNITSDPSYYYIIFADETQQATDPESFLYGKLSITGNGLGAFVYNDGVLDQNYEITSIPVKTGTLSDGSIRNDLSDFITYPYNATKILFDDLTMIYQPKLPVHDGSDHNIIGENVLSKPEQIVLATDTAVIDTGSFRYVSVQPNGTGSGTLGGFAIGDHIRFGLTTSGQPTNATWTGSNDITTTSARVFDTYALDLRKRATITFSVIKGNNANGGEESDSGEDFKWWYSIDGKQTWTLIGIIAGENDVSFNTLNTSTVTLPLAARTEATYLRIGQSASSGYQYDHWGLTQIVFDTVSISDPEAPKISADAIVYDASLLLNYDFSNLATYPGTGTTVKNLSSSSYTGTINGSTFNSAGYFEFDGVDDDVSVSSSFVLSDTQPITIESWVNADTTTNTFQVISTAKATTTHWQLSFTGDPTYNILWAFAGTSNSVGTTTLPSTGAWHHIVATYNGGDKTQLASWKVYVDSSSSTIQLTGSTGAATNETTIGFRTGGAVANRFDGKIGEVRIYNRELTATEVSQNFNATRAKYGV